MKIKHFFLPNYETTEYKSIVIKTAVLVAFSLAVFFRDSFLPEKLCKFFGGELASKVLAGVILLFLWLIADEAMNVSSKREKIKKRTAKLDKLNPSILPLEQLVRHISDEDVLKVVINHEDGYMEIGAISDYDRTVSMFSGKRYYIGEKIYSSKGDFLRDLKAIAGETISVVTIDDIPIQKC